MKIYLAAPWAHKDQAKKDRDTIQAADPNLQVISRWLDFQPHSDVVGEYPQSVLQQEAENDVADLMMADALVVMNYSMSEGKACETGMALTLGIPVISVGDGRNVFLNLTQVTRVVTLEDAIYQLQNLPTERD